MSEVAGDMNIMFENAKKYNAHTSRLYKCAVKLQKIMQERVQELLEFDQVIVALWQYVFYRLIDLREYLLTSFRTGFRFRLRVRK